ncbi:MAG TPA: four helix bundle protein [Vicinamibacterales bacterium]
MGISHALKEGMSNKPSNTFRRMRVWESALAIKRSLYDLLDGERFKKEERLRNQLREAAASAVSHISEGHARFDPLDHARFLKMAKASLAECQNHLIDAVDRRVIDEELRQEHDDRIKGLLKGLVELIAYLQSPQAKRNAERIKKRRVGARRH